MQEQGAYYTDLLKFKIFTSEGGPIPSEATIQSATLSLYKFTYYDMNYSLNRMLVSWSEANATWLQRDKGLPWGMPGAQGSNIDFAAVADATAATNFNPGWITFDVTATVQQLSNGQLNNGWRLIGLSGNTYNNKRFYTREYTADPALRPKLTITYAAAP